MGEDKDRERLKRDNELEQKSLFLFLRDKSPAAAQIRNQHIWWENNHAGGNARVLLKITVVFM